MNAVFDMPQQYCCRSCGSQYLPRSQNGKEEVCVACWDDFLRWLRSIGSKDRSRLMLNRWLARRLMLEANRMAIYGVTGRCEAVRQGPRGYVDGFDAQCRSRATKLRDGYKVCGQHAKAKAVVFIGDAAHNPYVDFERALASLAKDDPRFKECLARALTSITPTT